MLITDFGFAIKLEDLKKEERNSCLGTPTHYPYEMLVPCLDPEGRRIVYDERVDIWCLGIILYALLYQGMTPFETDPFDREKTKKLIRALEYSFPAQRKPYEYDLANDLIKKILVHPEKRPTLDDILQHPFSSAFLPGHH